MPSHPVRALNKLLKGRPIYHTVDNYPTPWGALLGLVQSAPPLPQTRLAALKIGLAALPDSALDSLQESLRNPRVLHRFLPITPHQRDLLDAVRRLGPVQCGDLAEFLGRDRSNVHHSLQGLVSQNRIMRVKRGRKVYYRIPDLIMRAKPDR